MPPAENSSEVLLKFIDALLLLKSPSCVGNNKEISEAAAPGPLI